ncbi:uncharacterized protein TRIADDRAFT_53049 [Trichoplax adhaerens]|uniref:Mitochondrial import receptor subunit TOM22 homolog n=1 Tax=Trichoplax adhaerens TaxID=10228 RepID=B3RN60_TRIAD|nr:hypothetical protein TRIADDRAFT_53049 [Trichoplax adhaerens]EDV27963.1 hypothetical protein TRIADDRAFT_53049 [Trichoplax adhaerens]|eukprot:XP_002109797.1 hypothetical protein TRIADDRAFT_53049 [Trichoplax adhaerens]
MVSFISESETDDQNHSITEEEDEFIEETIGERLWGLTDMFPEIVQNSISVIATFSMRGGKNVIWFTSKAIWITSTSFMMLVLPVMLEIERVTVEEQQLQQQRQILLGPNAAASGYGPSTQGLGALPSMPGPQPKS